MGRAQGLMLVMALAAACPARQGSSSSSGGGAAPDAGGTASGGGSSSLGPGPRVCHGQICHFQEVCVLTPDGGSCAAPCAPDAGCALPTQVCRALVADAGVWACMAGGGVGDGCGDGLACGQDLLCAHTPDASASCRRRCGAWPDAGLLLECPANYVCFPAVDDAGAGACFPR